MNGRLLRLRDRFGPLGIDALVVTELANVRYLSGFSGSNGTLAVTLERAVLITDSRYEERARNELSAVGATEVEMEITRESDAALATILDTDGRIGLEASHVSWAHLDRLRERFEWLIATSNVVEAMRERKSADELKAIRGAASIADAALADTRLRLAAGLTEREFAHEIDDAMRRNGADRPGYQTIVASGPNASRPHHAAGDRRIGAGDLVILDVGAELDGYRSDMTRSFVIGPPSDRQAELLDAVREAQAAGVEAAGPGVPANEIDRACRSHLESAGLGDYFIHGTGHGVGLVIHEAPWVNATSTATLAPGHVITVEPGVYIPDYGGVRWEDTLVITENGAEAATGSPKDPVIG